MLAIMLLLEEEEECGCTGRRRCDCALLEETRGRLRLAQRKLAQARRTEDSKGLECCIRKVKLLQDEVDRFYRARKK